jgi:adenylate cyclase
VLEVAVDGVRFGRYTLIGLIGEGGMGKVFKAHDTTIGRDVAIKVLPAELAGNPEYRRRFRREVHIVARLTEPHIIPIHDTGEIEGRLYLVMPIVEGIDVASLLKRDGPMAPALTVRVIEQLAAALDAAHSHGLVHRDVKPSNALITSKGFVYLIDFGVAHDAAATKITQTGSLTGTYAYMAPERFTGGTADARADIYSLACVLHECLTGSAPFPADTIEQQILAHLYEDPPRPSTQEVGVPTAFDAVIARGMAKTPNERYSTALELASAARLALMQPAAASDPNTRSNAETVSSTSVMKPAEYKQVTVLFADVVHSMDIAMAAGAERWREIVVDLVNCCAAVVQRYGGTVDKFTGDGIMAVFGAPAALENHAFRACLAALEILETVQRLAAEVKRQDGLDLQLRVGLNSGQVIVGDIGSTPMGYTAVGDQVGMAQRMESAAQPGAVLLSESTAQLVESAAVLGKPELVYLKGVDEPVPARRLLSLTGPHLPVARDESMLIGRDWQLDALAGLLDQAIDGYGSVASVVGPAGIGKSRLVRELALAARTRGVDVFWAFCEAHTSDVPFYLIAALLRAAMRVADLDSLSARERIRARLTDADPDDLLLLDDLLGIADPDFALPKIDPDARRRRLTALVQAASLSRTTAAVFVIEDVHWIDEVSELMLADFLTVIRQTPSVVVITYRTEYHGTLSRSRNAQTIALPPLGVSQSAALTAQLLGSDPSVDHVAAMITDRAAGNPFFIEEMVRDLAERRVLSGERGRYSCPADVTDVSVPATLQATIAARIDRLQARAKRTLSAAAVIGSTFDTDLLTSVGVKATFDELLAAELIDQTRLTPRAEYAFRHPLIRKVAYESQLKSDRARLHRRLAAAIEGRDTHAPDENAPLIAEHLEAAGDLHEAYAWHMRAGAWSWNRDVVAARTSWQRARAVADRLAGDDPDRTAMRIAVLAQLCATGWRASRSVADAGFEELRGLCTAADEKVALATAMMGQLMELTIHAHRGEAGQLATEYVELLESIGDPAMTVGLSFAAIFPKYEAGQMAEALQLARHVIDLADGDPSKGNLIFGSPLALATGVSGLLECFLGLPGWKDHMDQGIALGRASPDTHVVTVMYKYIAIADGALAPDAAALHDTGEALRTAEQYGDNFLLALARLTRGITLIHLGGPDRARGVQLLGDVGAVTMSAQLLVDAEIASEKARAGDVLGAIELSRAVTDKQFATATMMWRGRATSVLVEALLRRGGDADLQQAQDAIERLAAVPTDAGLVIHELPLLRLRALLARAKGDEVAYRHLAQRYRATAISLGFEGHMAMAESFP